MSVNHERQESKHPYVRLSSKTDAGAFAQAGRRSPGVGIARSIGGM